MHTRLVVIVVAFWSAVCLGQAEEPIHKEMVAKIREEGFQRSKIMETASYLTDVYGPRLTGSPLTRTAGEWARSRLAEWGLHNVHLAEWGPFGRGWSLEGFSCNMVAPNFAPLVAYPKAWSPSTPKTVRGKPVYLDAATEKDLDKYRGKLHRAIVLISPPREVKAAFEPLAKRQTDEALLALANADVGAQRVPSAQRASVASAGQTPAGGGQAPAGGSLAASSSAAGQPDERTQRQLQNRKWQLCYEEGAAVVIEPGRGDGGTVFLQSVTLPTRGDDDGDWSRRPRPWAKDAPAIVPQVVMAVEHYNRIIRMLQKGSQVELAIDIASRYHEDDLNSFNVLGEIPGGDRADEIVMLGAHLDSWHAGTGATDNAVGCAVAMEAVRILQAVGAKPRRTIRIALWTGEEQGLFGSKAYVAEHFGRQLPPAPAPPEASVSSGNNAPAGQNNTAAQGSTPGAEQPGAAQRSAGQTEGGADSAAQSGAAQSGAASSARAPAAQPSPRARGTPRYELKPAHDKFCAYFNLDNGTGKIRGIYLQGNEALRPIFRAWLAPFNDLGAATITAANTGGTDHLSFDAVGLPGFQFIQDPLEYSTRTHHSNMDVYERLQEDDIKQAAVIMASFVYHAAMRDEKLPRKPLRGEVSYPLEAPEVR